MYYTCLLKATGHNMCEISWMSCTEQRPDVEYIWMDGWMDGCREGVFNEVLYTFPVHGKMYLS